MSLQPSQNHEKITIKIAIVKQPGAQIDMWIVKLSIPINAMNFMLYKCLCSI